MSDGCLYCPGCGHKWFNKKTESGEYEPADYLCIYCLEDDTKLNSEGNVVYSDGTIKEIERKKGPEISFDEEAGKLKITCDWDGFAWVWDLKQEKWLIDLHASGGPPSPHDPSPSEPPFKVIRNDSGAASPGQNQSDD